MQLGNGSASQLNVMLEGTQMDCVRSGESTVSKIDMVLEFIQCLSLRGKIDIEESIIQRRAYAIKEYGSKS